MNYILNILKALFIVAIVLFCVFNTDSIQIVVLKDHFVYELPTFLLFLGGFAFGAFFIAIYYLADKIRAAKEIKKLNKQLKNSKTEVDKLSNLPLTQSSDKHSELRNA